MPVLAVCIAPGGSAAAAAISCGSRVARFDAGEGESLVVGMGDGGRSRRALFEDRVKELGNKPWKQTPD